MTSGSGTSEGRLALDDGGRLLRLEPAGHRGRRSKEEIYGCSDRGQEVSRCEGRGGRGEGLDGGRPLAAETTERERLRREEDARKSVFPSMSAFLPRPSNSPLL